jgi:hypothetical protein
MLVDIEDLDRVLALGRARQEPERYRHDRRSHGAMLHARTQPDKQRGAAKAEALAKKAARQDHHLAELQRLAPEVARALSIRVGPASTKKGPMKEDRARCLLRVAFGPPKIKGLGVTHARLQAFVMELYTDLRDGGLLRFLNKCALWRKCSSSSVSHIVVMSYSHESDGTTQSIAQHVIQRIGRPCSKQLSTEVFNQRGTLHARFLIVDTASDELLHEQKWSQDWDSNSCVMLGKTSTFILAALQRACLSPSAQKLGLFGKMLWLLRVMGSFWINMGIGLVQTVQP